MKQFTFAEDPNTNVYVLLDEAQAEIDAYKEAIKVAQQALMEVHHAQSVGANWYTHGEHGLNKQTGMWVRKGLDAIAKHKGKGE